MACEKLTSDESERLTDVCISVSHLALKFICWVNFVSCIYHIQIFSCQAYETDLYYLHLGWEF